MQCFLVMRYTVRQSLCSLLCIASVKYELLLSLLCCYYGRVGRIQKVPDFANLEGVLLLSLWFKKGLQRVFVKVAV